MLFHDISSIISPHLNSISKDDRDYKKYSTEICHVGKLLASLEEKWIIEELRESPDFIIRSGNTVVGLEHRIIVDTERKRGEGEVLDVFKTAEKVYSSNYPQATGLLNIFIKKLFPAVKKSQKDELVQQINHVIYRFFETQKVIENSLIDDIFCCPFNELSFVPNEGAWMQSVLTIDQLEKAVTMKDVKHSLYSNSMGTNELWLLLVIGAVGSSSYEMNDELVLNIDTKFSRVYLLEDFNWKVNRMK